MIWYRIDNRLVHGQIIEAWLPYLQAAVLIVANDELACDSLRQQIVLLAVPTRIRTEFAGFDRLPQLVKILEEINENALVLFADCFDVPKALGMGINIPMCNVGNMHYAADKELICPHVALSAMERSCLRTLETLGIILDFRCVPMDNPQPKNW